MSAQPSDLVFKNDSDEKKPLRAREWFFTLNNYTQDDVNFFEHVLETQKDKVRFVCFQQEKGEKTGTPHLQGVIVFWNPQQRNGWWKKNCNRARREVVISNVQYCVNYCTKKETRIIETQPYIGGEIPQQGARTDLTQILEDIKEGHTLKEISEKYPGDWMRYYRGIKELYELHAPRVEYDIQKDEPNFEGYKDWQEKLLEIIKDMPDDRKIHIVLDIKGGQGKSTFVKHLVSQHDAVMLNGKKADMLHAYTGQPVVCIDLSRTQADYICYDGIEQLKNGLIFKTKYESRMCVYKKPHVIIMTNKLLDSEAMSHDRYDYIFTTEYDKMMYDMNNLSEKEVLLQKMKEMKDRIKKLEDIEEI